MAFTAGFSVNVGDPTKASDVDVLAANDDYLKNAIDTFIANDANNRVLTGTGSGTANAETNLTFDGSTLTVTGTVSATTFSGNVTGNLTGDVTGNISGNVTGGTISGSTGTFSGDVAVNTSTLKVDTANNRVGIKNAGPSYPLDIGYTAGVNQVAWRGSSNEIGFLTYGSSTDAGAVQLSSGGAAKILFDAAGLSYINTGSNFGIGTSSPTRLLSLYSNSPTSVFQSFTNSSTGNTASDGAQIGIDSNNDLQIGQLESGKLIEFYNNGSLAMVIDSSQRVGIGGVTPSAWLSTIKALQVGDGASVYNAGGAGGDVYYNNNWYVNSSSQNIYLNNGYALSYGQAGGEHRWFTAPSGTAGNTVSFTQAMTLTNAGLLGLGTSSPSALLHLYKNGSTQAGLIETDQSASVFNFKSTGQTAGQPQIGCSGSNLILNTNGSERARITSDGKLCINRTSGNSALSIDPHATGEPNIQLYNKTNDAYTYLKNDGSAFVIQNSYGTTAGFKPIQFMANGSVNLHIDEVGGSVGIGTDSPDTLIHAEAADGAVGGAIKYTATGVASGYLSASPDGTVLATDTAGISFRTGVTGNDPTDTGSAVMTILSGGDVGLGTQSPEIRLSVTDTYNGSALTSNDIPAVQIINEQGSYTADNVLGVLGFGKSQGFASGVRAGMVAYYSGTGSQSSNVGAYLAFRTSADAAGNSTERLRITSDGKVGIGSQSPTYKLVVSNGGAAGYEFNVNGLNGGVNTLTYNRSTSAYVDSAHFVDNYYIYSGQTPAERFRVESSGVCAFMTPNINIRFNGTATQSVLTNNDGVEIYTGGYIWAGRQAASLYLNRAGTTGDVAVFYYNSTTSVGSISVTSSATAYNTSSDYRLKENLVPITGAIDRVNALQPRRFNFLSDPNTTVDGFVAHEVSPVVPEAISGEKDAVDEDGSPEYQGIDQSKLVPLLTAAIQELTARIEALEAA